MVFLYFPHHDIIGCAVGAFVVLLTGLPDPQRRVIMARLGRQNSSAYHRPIARRLLTHSSRTGSSNTPDKEKKTVRRRVVKANDGIVEKILLVGIVVLVLLCTILRLR